MSAREAVIQFPSSNIFCINWNNAETLASDQAKVVCKVNIDSNALNFETFAPWYNGSLHAFFKNYSLGSCALVPWPLLELVGIVFVTSVSIISSMGSSINSCGASTSLICSHFSAMCWIMRCVCGRSIDMWRYIDIFSLWNNTCIIIAMKNYLPKIHSTNLINCKKVRHVLPCPVDELC